MGLVSKLNEDLSVKTPKRNSKKSGIKTSVQNDTVNEETGQILLMEKPDSFAKAMKISIEFL